MWELASVPMLLRQWGVRSLFSAPLSSLVSGKPVTAQFLNLTAVFLRCLCLSCLLCVFKWMGSKNPNIRSSLPHLPLSFYQIHLSIFFSLHLCHSPIHAIRMCEVQMRWVFFFTAPMCFQLSDLPAHLEHYMLSVLLSHLDDFKLLWHPHRVVGFFFFFFTVFCHMHWTRFKAH